MNCVAVDLFCGIGGLTYGIRKAGITVAAGIDLSLIHICPIPSLSSCENVCLC